MAMLQGAAAVAGLQREVRRVDEEFVARGDIDFFGCGRVGPEGDPAQSAVPSPAGPVDVHSIPIDLLFNTVLAEVDQIDAAMALALLGAGQADNANVLMKRAEVGIPGNFEDFAFPKSLVPYSRGQIYYHEGLSLQECVLPCLTVRLNVEDKKAKKAPPPRLTLSYRQGKSDKITSLRPVVNLSWPEGNLFAEENEIEVAIEASDSKGTEVGWVGASQAVNAATGGVRIRPGAAIAVGLRMEDSFSGTFVVRAFDPNTNITLAELTLKTDYLE